MLEKYYKLQPTLVTIDELKGRPVEHQGRAVTRTHQHGGGKLHQALDRLIGYSGGHF